MKTNLNFKKLRNETLSEFYSEKNVHDHYKNMSVNELVNITHESTFPFWVMTLNVLGDLNVATVIRSAHLLGAERCVVFGRRKIDNRGLVGASHYTQVDKVMGIDESLNLRVDTFRDYCMENRLIPIIVEHGGESCFSFNWKTKIDNILQSNMKPILVLGTEREGIPPEIISESKFLGGYIVTIPQRGVIRSHNLSMAFAIVAGSMVQNMGWH
jgi:tRNA G18 (ribose-2'-O)-methylase SpoU